MKYVIFALVLLFASQAQAQNQARTTESSSTIAVTNAFQQVLADPSNSGGIRKGCMIQNQGTSLMYVFFGPIAGATKAKSFVLQPPQASPAVQGGAMNCSAGGDIILQDQISITGTITEAFAYAEQR